MGANFSRDDFEDALAKAKAGRTHFMYDVSLGRDFKNPSQDARDPKCIWARLDGRAVVRVRVGGGGHLPDILTLYENEAETTTHAIHPDDKDATRLVMEERSMVVKRGADMSPTFSPGLKIHFGSHKWQIAPVAVERKGLALRHGVFVVHDASGKKKTVDKSDTVGLIKVDDFVVTEFVLDRSFSPILVGSVLYLLTKVYNGLEKVQTEKKFASSRTLRVK